MDDQTTNPQQPQNAQQTSSAQPMQPAQPYKQNLAEKTLHKGHLILSFVAMITSFIALFKRFSGKK